MTRPRSQTIGTLGKSSARTGSDKIPTIPTAPKEPPPGDRAAIRRWVHGALFDNVGLKFLSMVLAVTVFLLVNTDKEREITVQVGVKYDYPADKVLTSKQLDEVRVTIKGPWRRLRGFHERELGRVRLDLMNAPTAADIAITPDMITNLPPGLKVTSISPQTVRVQFDKVVEKPVEVVAMTAGRPQHGYVVAEIKPVPPTVKVRGGEQLLAALTSVRTTDVSLEGRTENFEMLAELAPPEGVAIDPTQRVTVHVRIEEELVTRRFPGLPVAIRIDGIVETTATSKWAVTPAQVEVTLTGALLAVEKAKNTMVPYVKITLAERGAREVPVVIDGLPPGVGIRLAPERVRLAPARPTPPAPVPAPAPPPAPTPTAPVPSPP